MSADRTQPSLPSAPVRLRVTEIFHSIQGESSYAGWPCLFVRLTGCNLRCAWCDSQYTFSGGAWMTLADVLTRLDEFPACRLVQVTGGEPLLQDGSISLLQALLDQGKEVLLETSGSVSLARVPVDVVRIVDLKPPGSGEVESNLWENIELLVAHDEVKCVLRDRVDYDWAVDRVQRHGLLDRVAAVHFSPVFGELDPATLTSWVLQDGLGVRVNLQLHKLIWDPTARGV